MIIKHLNAPYPQCFHTANGTSLQMAHHALELKTLADAMVVSITHDI